MRGSYESLSGFPPKQIRLVFRLYLLLNHLARVDATASNQRTTRRLLFWSSSCIINLPLVLDFFANLKLLQSSHNVSSLSALITGCVQRSHRNKSLLLSRQAGLCALSHQRHSLNEWVLLALDSPVTPVRRLSCDVQSVTSRCKADWKTELLKQNISWFWSSLCVHRQKLNESRYHPEVTKGNNGRESSLDLTAFIFKHMK